ncbi:hypothetical protein F8Y91_22900 [Vibrio alginolyticus]|uniref:hypothetical protein n=1 Tax=Vibrio alginolyticus TaxID=663 RepID=UPI001D7B2921|nr:hypothetical protein [Vibrio alginolyticus]EGQ9235333.1 hypothetical protein [Vibrio alginolyticus]MCR9561233.1 hypothetical protein [Vibrio alginolyticus]
MTEEVRSVPKKQGNNKVWSIMSIIFLGSLGSGLWELFLKDVLFYTLQWITDIGDSLFSGFADGFYSDVGKASQSMLTILVPLIFVFAVIGFAWRNVILYFVQTSDDYNNEQSSLQSQPRERTKFLSVFYPVMTLLITVTYGYALISDIYNYKVSIYTDRTIEILRPEISEDEYFKLRSLYRQVETREQFQYLFNELNRLGHLHAISLPKLEPLMVKKDT